MARSTKPVADRSFAGGASHPRDAARQVAGFGAARSLDAQALAQLLRGGEGSRVNPLGG